MYRANLVQVTPVCDCGASWGITYNRQLYSPLNGSTVKEQETCRQHDQTLTKNMHGQTFSQLVAQHVVGHRTAGQALRVYSPGGSIFLRK